MIVLLAGASGALGLPITRLLLAHDHQVLGLTRGPPARLGSPHSAPGRWWPTR